MTSEGEKVPGFPCPQLQGTAPIVSQASSNGTLGGRQKAYVRAGSPQSNLLWLSWGDDKVGQLGLNPLPPAFHGQSLLLLTKAITSKVT